MTPQQMAAEALAAMQAGTRMTLVRVRGQKPPPKFPRGELMCENHDGRDVYSYDPAKIIAWLNAHRLVAIEIEGPCAMRPRPAPLDEVIGPLEDEE